MKATDTHQPVLLDEVLEKLNIKPDGIYVDATFGRGGHASAILAHLGLRGRLYALDKDPEAIHFATQAYDQDIRFKIHHGSFNDLTSFLTKENVFGKINGILFDLGVSSPQLDNPMRGFSFSNSGPLDMRMDFTKGSDAASWLNVVDEKELAQVLWKYGEERYARLIARAIVKARALTAIQTTDQLVSIISRAMPKRQKGKHPATRSFQAIRIAINHELDELEGGLAQSLNALCVGGRLLVISFHSLEDRIVKQFMQYHERGDVFPAKLPVKQNALRAKLQCLGRGIKPSLEEKNRNPRSRSGILRVGEKLS